MTAPPRLPEPGNPSWAGRHSLTDAHASLFKALHEKGSVPTMHASLVSKLDTPKRRSRECRNSVPGQSGGHGGCGGCPEQAPAPSTSFQKELLLEVTADPGWHSLSAGERDLLSVLALGYVQADHGKAFALQRGLAEHLPTGQGRGRKSQTGHVCRRTVMRRLKSIYRKTSILEPPIRTKHGHGLGGNVYRFSRHIVTRARARYWQRLRDWINQASRELSPRLSAESSVRTNDVLVYVRSRCGLRGGDVRREKESQSLRSLVSSPPSSSPRRRLRAWWRRLPFRWWRRLCYRASERRLPQAEGGAQ